VKRAVLTNLHLDLDYNVLKAAVPANVDVAFDGWTARLSL
jgi:phosphoribosyl 1,2-cyclic phosphate phosphodiesterase